MKLWLKYLIFIIAGIISAFVIPTGSPRWTEILDFLVDIFIHFGRYALLPLLFFSVATALFKLRDEGNFGKTTLWTLGVIVVSSLTLTLIGLLSALFIHLPRVPITIEKVTEVQFFSLQNLLLKLFPYSGFDALRDGAFLLPCFIFAGLAGAGSCSDKVASKSAVSLFDSLSKVCYIVMSLFTEFLSLGMLFIAARWSLNFASIIKSGVYNYLILLLFIELLVVALIIYPAVLHFLCHELHPYRVLYAGLCSFLVAFFSGDTNLSLVLNYRFGKESLGIKRRINAFSFPLFSVFARGGAALVETICFVLILRSYSSLGISVADVFWIGGISLLFSFVLGEISCGGPFFAITSMCLMYGKGFESGYLLLKDAAPIICAFACGIDSLTAIFGSYIVAVKTQMIQHQEIKKFI